MTRKPIISGMTGMDNVQNVLFFSFLSTLEYMTCEFIDHTPYPIWGGRRSKAEVISRTITQKMCIHLKWYHINSPMTISTLGNWYVPNLKIHGKAKVRK